MRAVAVALFAAALALPAPVTAADKALPYWASIVPGQARLRTGPGRNFPATWLYQRRGLPLLVIGTYPNWRRVRDHEGTVGWMQANLLSERRTAIVTGATARPLHARPASDARIVWRVAPGVVGALSACDGDWCLLETGGKRGYVQKAGVWGVGRGERFR